MTAAEFRGHSDSETAADLAARVLFERGLTGNPDWRGMLDLGHEPWPRLEARRRKPDAKWSDVSGLVDRM